MQMGLLMLGDASVQTMVERARLADAVGYGTVWLADERFYREVYACLAHFAACTSKVLLGPCVTDPFSRHPALTAMAIATLDEISDQRAILGIGAGISGFTELGINRRKPARAIREMIEVIRALLRGESVDFHGEVIDLHQGRLSFVPTRSAVPIYVASNGHVGEKKSVEQATLQHLRKAHPMLERGIVRGTVARMRPHSVLNMAYARHVEGVEPDGSACSHRTTICDGRHRKKVDFGDDSLQR